MAEESTEICGFLNVKYLGNKRKVQKVKKRTLAPWKVWRRHWCSIKKLGPGLSVIVQLDYGISNGSAASSNEKDNSVIIPLDAIICRTQSRSKQFAFGIFLAKERKPLLYLAGNSETESQRWIANIRQLLKPRKHRFMPGAYSISMVDNAHSKASGLTGLYGDLVASTIGVFVKDAHSGKIVENFEWKELDQFHLITAGRPEDVKCICVIHTTKEFRGGVGELHMFCLEASKLLQDLVTQGRGPKNRHAERRPLSLSEGDLRISVHEGTQRNYPILGSKFATGFMDTSVGLFSSSRSDMRTLNKKTENCVGGKNTASKTHGRAIENVYQPEPPSVPNITSSLEDQPDCSHNRRISDISTASGIYEEIADETDNGKIVTSNFNAEQYLRTLQLEEPPPLPPRQRSASESIRGTRSHDVMNPDGGIACMISLRNAIGPTKADAVAQNKVLESCNYVPMSPRLKDSTLQQQENDYVIMR